MSINIIPVKIKEDIQPGDDITGLILSYSRSIDDGDIVVISQKNYIKTRRTCDKS